MSDSMKHMKQRASWPYCCGQEMSPRQDSLLLVCEECGLVVEFKSQKDAETCPSVS